jgi:hypothetical protein
MTDAELGKLVHAAFDGAGFVETIRERLQNAVADVIGESATAADVHASRTATEEIATLLVARWHEIGHARAPYAAAVGTDDHRSTAADDVEERATAFRAMAGVRM